VRKKLFNWSEVHLSEVTSYIIHILIDERICRLFSEGSLAPKYVHPSLNIYHRPGKRVLVACSSVASKSIFLIWAILSEIMALNCTDGTK
jgi:hypothetical protein